MTNALLVGATGLVGSHILSTLLASPTFSSITTLSRRELSAQSDKLKAIIAPSEEWGKKIADSTVLTQTPDIFISSLGTTRANAGGLEGQRKIDYDLNLECAREAKGRGVRCYVLISTNGANPSSTFAYPRVRGELEEAVKALNFEKTVILRPGLLVGDRNQTRMVEGAFRNLAKVLGGISNSLKDPWAQDADVVAKAAVMAGKLALKGEDGGKEKVWMVGMGDVVRLGRTEWKD